MLKALWFLVKLSVLLAAIVWVVERPGTLAVNWLGYEIETSVGVAAAALLLVVFVWTQFYRLYRAVVGVPAVVRRYRIAQRREKGYRAVTSGLVAIAAGDARGADRFARRAADLIPGTPLTKLLQAQNALLAGNAPQARRTFAELLDDGDAAFLGLRGLLTEAVKDNNMEEALALVTRADALQPNRRWVVRTLFELQCRNRRWRDAERTLKRGQRRGLFADGEAKSLRQALYAADAAEALAIGDHKAAERAAAESLAIDAAFTPAALLLADARTARDRRGAAEDAIEKSWAAQPHPGLAERWMTLQPAPRALKHAYDAGEAAVKHAQRLADLAPQHRESHRLMGRALMQARRYREARDHLLLAGDYRRLSELEIEDGHNTARARDWLEKAADQPPAATWVCTGCHHADAQWHGLCPSCGAFGLAEWMVPKQEQTAPLSPLRVIEGGFIAPPSG